MTHKHLIHLFMTLSLALFLAACGGDGPADPTPGDDTGDAAVMTEEAARELEALAVQSLQSQMMLFQGVDVADIVPLSATSLTTLGGIQPQQYEDCVDIRGDTSDVDDDGIPAGAVYYFNCSESANGYTLTIEGSINMKDFFPDEGYLISFNDFYFEMEFGGERTFFRADGFVKVQRPQLDYIATVDFEMAFEYGGEAGAISVDMTQTFSTYDDADEFARGRLSYEGNLTFTSEGKTYRLTARTDPALEVKRSCATGFESGAVVYGDTHGNSLRLSVTCEGYSSTYNGGSF